MSLGLALEVSRIVYIRSKAYWDIEFRERDYNLVDTLTLVKCLFECVDNVELIFGDLIRDMFFDCLAACWFLKSQEYTGRVNL